MAKNSLETQVSQSHGSVAREKNTIRVWVPASMFGQIAVTGTWALEENSDLFSLATDDAGSTNVIEIPLPMWCSDAALQSGTGVTDRGVQVIGVEVFYQVAASALGGFDLDIYRITLNSTAVPTVAEVTTTLSADTGSDDGTEVDTHRMEALINARDRFYLDSGNQVYGQLDITDGTSSDVNLFGAMWHLKVVEE